MVAALLLSLSPFSIPLYLAAALLALYGCNGLLKNPNGWAWTLPLVVVCLALPPQLSDDYHRYLLEGHAQVHGFSPYRHPPKELAASLDHPSETLVSYPELTTIYPPVAQHFFRVSAWLGDSVYAWKAVMVLVFLLFYRFAGPLRTETGWWLAAPPLLFEGFWNAHLDALGLVFAALLLVAVHRKAAAVAGLIMAALVGLKLLPILWLPVCLIHLGPRRLPFLASFAVGLLLVFGPYVADLPHLMDTFALFAQTWSFNNPLYAGLAYVTNNLQARTLLTGLLIGALGLIYLSRRPASWQMSAAWVALICCSPTVHPWYLVWLLALAPADRRIWAASAYVVALLAYHVLPEYRESGIWREWLWLIVLEWLGLAFCFWQLLRPTFGKTE